MLYYNTVNSLLKNCLHILMEAKVFGSFRLVGGTSLSLQLGHRKSVDIDLFSEAAYGSLDFDAIDNFMERTFSYANYYKNLPPGIGKSYLIGNSAADNVKVDVFYTDPFISPELVIDNIRLASLEEITAMKLDVVQRGGRKKDFWDLHELLFHFSLQEMLQLHQRRYEYDHDENLILQNFTDFSLADEDFDPECLQGKFWEVIKNDLKKAVAGYTAE